MTTRESQRLLADAADASRTVGRLRALAGKRRVYGHVPSDWDDLEPTDEKRFSDAPLPGAR